MAKRLTISLDNWVFDRYLADIKYNRSSYIVEMMISGIELSIGSNIIKEGTLQTLKQENRNLQEETKNLKAILGKYNKKYQSIDNKEKLDSERSEGKRVKAFHESLRRSGHLAGVGERK
jgi:hypothetical protein